MHSSCSYLSPGIVSDFLLNISIINVYLEIWTLYTRWNATYNCVQCWELMSCWAVGELYSSRCSDWIRLHLSDTWIRLSQLMQRAVSNASWAVARSTSALKKSFANPLCRGRIQPRLSGPTVCFDRCHTGVLGMKWSLNIMLQIRLIWDPYCSSVRWCITHKTSWA